MTPPPIRYPLFWIVGLVLLGVVSWTGRDVIAKTRAAINARWTRVVEGPPVPSSSEPKVIEGTITRRALLLREGVEARDRPDGKPVETIRRRMFVDVYDVWPLTGEPKFLRIGNRRPFGWVTAQEALAWNTRLTLRFADSEREISSERGLKSAEPITLGTEPVPVVDWDRQTVRIVTWKPDQPWEGIERWGWIDAAKIPDDSWCVLLSRDEVLGLLLELSKPPNDSQRMDLRYRAMIGRLEGTRPLSAVDCEVIRKWLPEPVRNRRAASVAESLERLARINENWTTEASWSGRSFHAVSIDDIP